MLILLPTALLSIFIYQKKSLSKESLFEAFARAMLLFQVILLIITNVFSIFNCLNTLTASLSWILVIMITWALYIRSFGVFTFSIKQYFIRLSKQVNTHISELTLVEKLMLTCIAFISIVLFVGALFSVPYNYDSMTYHLARIGYWIDNQSVNHYITNIDRQLYSPVLDEYNLLHIYLLSKSDSFLNLLQYFAMLVCGMYLYKSARMLGTSRIFSIFAVFIFVTMPLTISQAITTQNDLFAAMWFSIFLYYLLQFILMDKIELHKQTIRSLLLTGISVGCAFLTKPSVCASMIFFIPWLLIIRLQKRDSLITLIKSGTVAAASMTLLICETFIRNFLSAGTLMPDTASGNIMVATKNIGYIIVNIMKNFSLILTQHLSDALNGFICRIAIRTGAILNVEVNHEAISFHGFDYIRHMNRGDNMYSHDITPSAFVGYFALLCGFICMILIVVNITRLLLKKSINNQNHSIGFSVSCWLSLGFIMALLRWQPWGTRLMYPALTISVIMIANLIDLLCKKLTKKEFVIIPLAALSLILSIPSMMYNMEPSSDNIKSGCSNRLERYFTFNDRYQSYLELTNVINKSAASGFAPTNEYTDDFVGLVISGDGYDYPLWLTFQQELPHVKLKHILLEDTADNLPVPNYILKIERGTTTLSDTILYKGNLYTCVFVSSNKEDALFTLNKPLLSKLSK